MTMASVLGEHEQSTIRAAFSALDRDVDVTLELGPSAAPVTLLAAGGRELDPNAITRGLVEAHGGGSGSNRLLVDGWRSSSPNQHPQAG